MKIIDLTHMMHPDMPVFPGTEKPMFMQANTVEESGFAETKFAMYSHTGTHIDAPAHMLNEGNSLDALDVSHFVGRAVIFDCTEIGKDEIAVDDLLCQEKCMDGVEFAILRTGWSERWGQDCYFDRFPSLTSEAAEWLAGLGLKGIGIDAISIDDIESNSFPVHHILFDRNMIVIENLTNLEWVQEEVFMFSCLPMKYEHADGSPVRAIAIEGIFE